jgi:hypothetical protein
MVRKAVVVAAIEEIIRGDRISYLGKTITLQLKQKTSASGLLIENYGPWSYVNFVKNTFLLLFCNDPGVDVDIRAILSDHCDTAVTLPDPLNPFALEDTRKAVLMASATNYPASLRDPEVQKRLYQDRSVMGPILGRFLGDADADLSGDLMLPLLIPLLGAENATPALREVLLLDVVDSMALLEPVPAQWRVALIRAMFRILGEPSVSSRVLQESITQAYLYNSVFDADENAYVPSLDVFPEPAERDAFASLVSGLAMDPESAARVVGWLQSNL